MREIRVGCCLPRTVPGELMAGSTPLSAGQGEPASLGMVVRPEPIDPDLAFCAFRPLSLRAWVGPRGRRGPVMKISNDKGELSVQHDYKRPFL